MTKKEEESSLSLPPPPKTTLPATCLGFPPEKKAHKRFSFRIRRPSPHVCCSGGKKRKGRGFLDFLVNKSTCMSCRTFCMQAQVAACCTEKNKSGGLFFPFFPFFATGHRHFPITPPGKQEEKRKKIQKNSLPPPLPHHADFFSFLSSLFPGKPIDLAFLFRPDHQIDRPKIPSCIPLLPIMTAQTLKRIFFLPLKAFIGRPFFPRKNVVGGEKSSLSVVKFFSSPPLLSLPLLLLKVKLTPPQKNR